MVASAPIQENFASMVLHGAIDSSRCLLQRVSEGGELMFIRLMPAALAASVAIPAVSANATDLEVTHWWTSGGEAAAVKVLADNYNALGDNKWVDGAIAGAGSTATP